MTLLAVSTLESLFSTIVRKDGSAATKSFMSGPNSKGSRAAQRASILMILKLLRALLSQASSDHKINMSLNPPFVVKRKWKSLS